MEIKFRNGIKEIDCSDVLIVKNKNDKLEYWNIIVQEESVCAIEITSGAILLTIDNNMIITFVASLEDYFIDCELIGKTDYDNLEVNVVVRNQNAKEE